MTVEEIEQILEMLAEKLGPAAEHILGIYVRQVWLEGLLWGFGELVIFLLALTSLVIALYAWRRFGALVKPELEDWAKTGSTGRERYQKAIQAYRDRESLWTWTMAGALIACAFWVVTFTLCCSQLLRLVNPEYFAIQMLIGR